MVVTVEWWRYISLKLVAVIAATRAQIEFYGHDFDVCFLFLFYYQFGVVNIYILLEYSDFPSSNEANGHNKEPKKKKN